MAATACGRFVLVGHASADRERGRSKLLLLSLEWPSSFNPFKRGSLSNHEEEWLSGFSCKHAETYKPKDRAQLLSDIREQWGSEDAFDEFVHTELLSVLRDSKAQYRRQLLDVATRSLELVMGD